MPGELELKADQTDNEPLVGARSAPRGTATQVILLILMDPLEGILNCFINSSASHLQFH